jgi:hypothetical protein
MPHSFAASLQSCRSASGSRSSAGSRRPRDPQAVEAFLRMREAERCTGVTNAVFGAADGPQVLAERAPPLKGGAREAVRGFGYVDFTCGRLPVLRWVFEVLECVRSFGWPRSNLIPAASFKYWLNSHTWSLERHFRSSRCFGRASNGRRKAVTGTTKELPRVGAVTVVRPCYRTCPFRKAVGPRPHQYRQQPAHHR